MTTRAISNIAAIEQVPLADWRLPESTFAALLSSAARTPNAKALSFFLTASAYDRPRTWTYGEFVAEVTRAANVFHAMGVTAEHPVAFVLPNLPETHFTIWGGEAAGAVLALNPLLEPAQLARLLRASRARVLVTLAPAPGAELWKRLSVELAGLPDLKHVAWVNLACYLEGAGSPQTQSDHRQVKVSGFDIVDLRTAMNEQPSECLVWERQIASGDISSYFCTGGTTGLPKIAVRTHEAEVFDAWSVAKVLESDGSPRTFFCGLPLFHVNAQLVTGLLPWMCGDHVVLGTPEGYRGQGVVQRFWDIVSHYRVTMFSGVPAIYASLLEVPVGASDISSLQFAICGAAPMPVKLIEAFESKTGIKILEGYGLTEGACVSSVNPPNGLRRPGSIGLRIPYQRMSAVVLDGNGRFVRKAEVDEVGIIAIRGPNVFSGYLDARHNEGLWIEIGGERWLNTGDLGRQDADGYFWLAGRKKELIIRGGHNIDPKIIEEALSKHPAVALVAAIGRPDAHAGELPVAYVQLKPGARATEQELITFAADAIPERAAIPKHISILRALPTTAVGKIFKPTLHKLEVEAVVRSEATRVGATITKVHVDEDPQRGNIARVQAIGNTEALKAALERFAFKWELVP
jgi:fatty-acyl-CoA synthase